ncbi:MAG: cytidine deaminase, partial [Proteobacteria bacterium]
MSDEICNQLVIGLVAPTGTNLNKFTSCIDRALEKFGIMSTSIKLSDFIENQVPTEGAKNNINMLNIKMTNGTKLRLKNKDASILAKYAVAQISTNRTNFQSKQAFVVNQLKRPEEVAYLRDIYGPLFFLIGVNDTRDNQISFLTSGDQKFYDAAKQLINRDQQETPNDDLTAEETKSFGQQTRATFHMADVFFDGSQDANTIIIEFNRFLNIVHSSPRSSPTSAEHFMYMAQTSALRSGDLSRQVGAVVITQEGELAGTGANDVPKAGGGQYWTEDKFDARDHWLGFDANKKQIDNISENTWDSLKEFFPGFDDTLKNQIVSKLKTSAISEITEYGRPVHAEMSAILSCTRLGVSTRNGTIFCTTYPCHNCAKHIIAAGIKQVFFIEPYPKSLAIKLHHDSIQDDILKETTENSVVMDSKR